MLVALSAVPRALGGECVYAKPSKDVKFSPRGLVNEESGIANSRLNPGLVWTHNDNFSPKHIFGVLTEGRAFHRPGDIAVVLSLEKLPLIQHQTDFEDISIAKCPYQNDKVNDTVANDDESWCIWVADTGSNFGRSHDIMMYVVKEPNLVDELDNYSPFAKMPLEKDVALNESFLFALDYDPATYSRNNVPNVEAVATQADGSRFWCIQKTFSDGGNGPAGIWESPQMDSHEALRSSNRNHHLVEECKNGWTTYTTDDGTKKRKQGWKCKKQVRFPNADVDAVAGDDEDDFVVIPHLFMSKVADVENPYPDCTREDPPDEEDYDGDYDGEDYGSERYFEIFDNSLPICERKREREPKGDHSCKQQKKWGKCREKWMTDGNYCERTCRRCRPAPPDVEEEVGVEIKSTSEEDPSLSQAESTEHGEESWQVLEVNCNETKADLRNIRNIAGADLSEDGQRLLIATYGGIFEYRLAVPHNFSTVAFHR